jgi:hypothetical protein
MTCEDGLKWQLGSDPDSFSDEEWCQDVRSEQLNVRSSVSPLSTCCAPWFPVLFPDHTFDLDLGHSFVGYCIGAVGTAPTGMLNDYEP